MMNSTKNISCFIVQRFYATQVSKSVAVIKIPEYVSKHVARIQKRDAERRLNVHRKISRRGDLDIPIITSNKKEYNFFYGQKYNKHFPVPLLSRYWMKQKTAGEKFTILSWDKNPSLPQKFECEEFTSRFICEFSQFNLTEVLLEGIKGIGYEQPTPMQALAIPKILQHNHCLCVAEAGCGKTMSYLIPIMQNLIACSKKIERFPNTPLALIISPGKELSVQIAEAAYQLGKLCGINVKALVPDGAKHDHLIPRDEVPIDILVASFGTVKKLASRNIFQLSHLQHLVLDEADTLLDSSFEEEMSKFLQYIMVQEKPAEDGVKPCGAQLILSSCTMPKSANEMFSEISAEGDFFVKIASPYHHRIPPHIPQKFIKVNNDNRSGALLELVKPDFKKKKSVMIFCNKSETCDWLSLFLEENEVPNAKFHAGMKHKDRLDSVERFQSGEMKVLCCTDLASRGLDTQIARHVVNFDFPNSVSDYLLRIGRVGRVGSNQGHVTNLVVSKSGAYTVQEIELAVRTTMKLPNVDANIKQKIKKLFFTF